MAGNSAAGSGGTMQALPECQQEPAPLPQDASCQDVANLKAHQLHCSGAPQEQVETGFQAALVACRKPQASQAEADFLGVVNRSRQRIALLLASEHLTPSSYLNRTWSISAKVSMSRKDPLWLTQWAQGDADGDLVPDVLDQCPDTPDLTATDLHGCVVADVENSHAPSAASVKAALAVTDVHVYTAACKDAPEPSVPSPVRFHIGINAPDLSTLDSKSAKINVNFMPSANQPVGCPVFYELLGNIEGLPGGSKVIRRVLVPNDLHDPSDAPNSTTPQYSATHCEFHRTGDNGTEKSIACGAYDGDPLLLHSIALPPGAEGYWHLRAVNGAGMASAWSDLPVRQGTFYVKP